MMKKLGIAKAFWIIFLCAVPIYFFHLYYFKSIHATPALDPETLYRFTLLLGLVGVLDIILAFYLPGLIQKISQKQLPWFFIYIIRLALVEAIAIYGLLIGFMGANWESVIPFFIVSAGGLILLFPSDEKLGIY